MLPVKMIVLGTSGPGRVEVIDAMVAPHHYTRQGDCRVTFHRVTTSGPPCHESGQVARVLQSDCWG